MHPASIRHHVKKGNIPLVRLWLVIMMDLPKYGTDCRIHKQSCWCHKAESSDMTKEHSSSKMQRIRRHSLGIGQLMYEVGVEHVGRDLPKKKESISEKVRKKGKK